MTEEGIEIPTDNWAEAAVVACAVASRRGAQLAAGRLKASDVWQPRLRAIFRAAVTLDDLPGVSEDDLAERQRRVSEMTGVPLQDIVRLVEERPVRTDATGSFARRVLDASRRRALMQNCARIYNELGHGATLDDIREELHDLETAVPC